MGSCIIFLGGGWVVGGCVLLGLVSDHMTPSVIPFWNPLTKCYAFQQKKDFFFNICRIFFFRFTIESAKSKSHLVGVFLHWIKKFFLAILFIYVPSTRIWSFTPQIEKLGIIIIPYLQAEDGAEILAIHVNHLTTLRTYRYVLYVMQAYIESEYICKLTRPRKR